MVLPATMFLAAAALRFLQPRQYEPARISWIIFEWTATHISHLGAAMLFLGMPGLVVVAGCATLLRMWSENQTLRDDAALALTIVQRYGAVGSLAVATLLGAAIFTLAIVHIVAD
jgi:hypothetical protein